MKYPMSGLSHYEINCEIDRFSFLETKKISNMDVYRSNYILDWEEITEEYLRVGIGNVPHFASQYVFAKALNAKRTSEREEMQTMYLDIISGVVELIASGVLPKTVEM